MRSDLGERMRRAILEQDEKETALCAADLIEADPSGRLLRRELWRLRYRHWRPARLWMERVRDTHPDHTIRDMFALLRAQFERVRDADLALHLTLDWW